jgi:hypothetical protein
MTLATPFEFIFALPASLPTNPRLQPGVAGQLGRWSPVHGASPCRRWEPSLTTVNGHGSHAYPRLKPGASGTVSRPLATRLEHSQMP